MNAERFGFWGLMAWVDFGDVLEVERELQVLWWFRHGEVEEIRPMRV